MSSKILSCSLSCPGTTHQLSTWTQAMYQSFSKIFFFFCKRYISTYILNPVHRRIQVVFGWWRGQPCIGPNTKHMSPTPSVDEIWDTDHCFHGSFWGELLFGSPSPIKLGPHVSHQSIENGTGSNGWANKQHDVSHPNSNLYLQEELNVYLHSGQKVCMVHKHGHKQKIFLGFEVTLLQQSIMTTLV